MTDKNVPKNLLLPIFNLIHVHAPQWINGGMGFSLELLPWLEQYTFPLEAAYKDTDFAIASYKKFINDLWRVGTTRVCMMATRHQASTSELFKLFRASGLGAYIGKVNMDRNATEDLVEETGASVRETEALIEENNVGHPLVRSEERRVGKE